MFGIYDILTSDHIPGLQKYDMCMTEQVPGPQGVKIVGRHMASAPNGMDGDTYSIILNSKFMGLSLSTTRLVPHINYDGILHLNFATHFGMC